MNFRDAIQQALDKVQQEGFMALETMDYNGRQVASLSLIAKVSGTQIRWLIEKLVSINEGKAVYETSRISKRRALDYIRAHTRVPQSDKEENPDA